MRSARVGMYVPDIFVVRPRHPKEAPTPPVGPLVQEESGPLLLLGPDSFWSGGIGVPLGSSGTGRSHDSFWPGGLTDQGRARSEPGWGRGADRCKITVGLGVICQSRGRSLLFPLHENEES